MPPPDSPYYRVVPFLKAALPSFDASPDYRLVAGNDDLPGVILAAYGRLLARLANAGAAAELARGVAAIEALHGWDDAVVRTAIRARRRDSPFTRGAIGIPWVRLGKQPGRRGNKTCIMS